jgi:hypothetical protein
VLLQSIDLENNIMATATAPKKGKTVFVREMLAKNPFANATAVNDAWKSSGQIGTVSTTLVNKQRAALGLAGNLRGKNRKTTDSLAGDQATTGKKRGPKPRSTANGTMLPAGLHSNGKTDSRSKSSRHSATLEELEADIDRLLFKVMGLGGLSAIEESLRQTRRLLYGKFSR